MRKFFCRLGWHAYREEKLGHHAVVLLRCRRCSHYKAIWAKW